MSIQSTLQSKVRDITMNIIRTKPLELPLLRMIRLVLLCTLYIVDIYYYRRRIPLGLGGLDHHHATSRAS